MLAGLFSITPAQSREHGLAPIGIEFSGGGAILATAFPETGVYATFSGPPGGPLWGRFLAIARDEHALTLEQLVRKHFDLPQCQPFVLGAASRCELGAMKECLVFVIGYSLARSSCFASVVEVGPAARLLVVFGLGCYAGVPEYRKIIEHASIAEIIATLKFSPE